jgi:hypothetical protein
VDTIFYVPASSINEVLVLAIAQTLDTSFKLHSDVKMVSTSSSDSGEADNAPHCQNPELSLKCWFIYRDRPIVGQCLLCCIDSTGLLLMHTHTDPNTHSLASLTGLADFFLNNLLTFI